MSNISSYANRREDFFFRREQSLETKSASWETRLRPLRPYLTDIIELAAIVALIGFVWFCVDVMGWVP